MTFLSNIESDGLSSGFLGETPLFTFVTNTYYNDGGWPTNPHVEYTETNSFQYPANPLSSVEGSSAGYRRVEEWQQNGALNNGKIIYEYSDLTYTTLWTQPDYFPYRPVDRAYWAVGLPLKTTWLNASGDTVKQIVNTYNLFQQIKTEDNYHSLFMSKNGEVDVVGGTGTELRFIYKFRNYYPIVGRVESASSKETIYSSSSSNAVYQLTNTGYDPNYYVPRYTTQLTSKGETTKKMFYYPFDYSLGAGSFATQMTTKNILQQPVLTETYILKAGGNYLVSSDLTEQSALGSGIIRPLTMHTSRLSAPVSATPGTFSSTVLLPTLDALQPAVKFNTYDGSSRLVEYEPRGGQKSAVIFDKSGNALASAKNAGYNNIAYSGFETEDMGNWTYLSSGVNLTDAATGARSYSGTITRSGLSSGNYYVRLLAKGTGTITVNGVDKAVSSTWTVLQWPLSAITSVSINTNGNLLDDVSLCPQSAQMSIHTYKLGIGILSTTDARGQITAYEYDEFNRLKNVRDQYSNILKHYEYKFNTPFTNVVQSGSFIRGIGSCPVGNYVPGPPVTFQVPAGKYTSIVSQADADAQALYEVYAYGQRYADINGTCIPIYYNLQLAGQYTRKNCGTGYIGGQVFYVVPASKYNSIISQDDADAKARADTAANGQNYANANGTCSVSITVSVTNNTSDNYVISFSGVGTSFNIAHNSSPSFTIPSGTYTANISPVSTNNVHNFYVGSRTAVSGTSATFTNVIIGTGSSENHFGIY